MKHKYCTNTTYYNIVITIKQYSLYHQMMKEKHYYFVCFKLKKECGEPRVTIMYNIPQII